MGVAAKAPSDTASRVRFALTQVILGIDFSRSAVPTHSSPAVVSTESALRLANPHAGGTMKSRTLTCITAITLFAVLAIPVQLAAQAHTRYQLIDIGTLGGPVSYDSVDGIADRFLMLNDAGIVASSADTPFSDPDTPNCFHPDCFLNHAFRWQKGVIADLGSLPAVH